MKKLLALLLLASAPVAAQDLYNTVAQEICDCVRTKIPEISTASAETVQREYMTCFLNSFGNHSDAILSIEGGKYNNNDNMEEFGEKVAMKMASNCPDYLMALAEHYQDDAPEARHLTVEGRVSDIRSEQFLVLTIKDKHTKSHTMVLMDFFESASLLTENRIKKNDNILATYTEVEMYDPKMKEFRNYKILTALEKK